MNPMYKKPNGKPQKEGNFCFACKGWASTSRVWNLGRPMHLKCCKAVLDFINSQKTPTPISQNICKKAIREYGIRRFDEERSTAFGGQLLRKAINNVNEQD